LEEQLTVRGIETIEYCARFSRRTHVKKFDLGES